MLHSYYYAIGLPIFTNEFIIDGLIQKERSLDASTILPETFPYQKITHVFETYSEAERLNLPVLNGTPDIFVGKNHDDDCNWSYYSKTERCPLSV